MKMSLICSIVLHKVMKYSLTFTIHDLAYECSRQILYQANLRGFNKNSSIIIVFLELDIDKIKNN
jgi:hypothetical protein